MSFTDPSAQAEPRAVTIRRLVVGLLLPLFFAIGFPLAFTSATHAPQPRELPLTVVGPNQVVGKIAASLDRTAQFSVTQTDVAAAARASVEKRTSDGAIEVTVVVRQTAKQAAQRTTFSVTTYVADAGGRGAAAAVQATGDRIAQQLGTTTKVVDVAPLATQDPLGTNLFYLLVYTSLGGYMVVIVMGQVWAGSRLRTRYTAVAITALLAPLFVFALSSIFVGDYGADFGTIVRALGVTSIYVATVGAFAVLIQQFIGRDAQFGVMAFIVFLNFPSAGAVSAGSMLPAFWQDVHQVYFGAGGFEALRSIVYFDGAGAGRWIAQLSAWLVGLVLLTVVVHLGKLVLQQRTQPSPSDEIALGRVERHDAVVGLDRPAPTADRPAIHASAPAATATD